jgi:hypothetical protein
MLRLIGIVLAYAVMLVLCPTVILFALAWFGLVSLAKQRTEE